MDIWCETYPLNTAYLNTLHPFDRRLKSKGITAAQLARKCQVKPAAMSHWITGKRIPTYPNLAKLAKGLKVSIPTIAKDFGL
jgi:transcriptional regulator with XRE-family HTH domain